jgi:predicted TIM-barrel fold metal-dependent hydrolase
MSRAPLSVPVPHSAGLNLPSRPLPENACDSHMHVFHPRFPPSAHWKHQPPHADVAMYRRLQQRLGTSRVVVVNPSTFGTDNACTLNAVHQLGEHARGVAVVGHEVTDAELDQLAVQRVCGLRVNFVSPQSWGTTTPEMLTTLSRKVARLGWHMQVLAHPEQLVELAPVLRTLPTPLVIDHLGSIDPAEGASAAAFRVLRSLLDDGNTWVKLSGAYMRSRAGEPAYTDVQALGSSLVSAAPERLVWGSDWPHTTQPKDSVNDANLVDLLRVWCSSDAVMDGILVDNPARLYGFAS